MKRLLIFLGVLLTFNLSSPSNTYAVNPIIAIEGIGLGLNILKDVGEKVKDGLGSKKKKKKYKTTSKEFICLNHYNKNSKNLVIGKFELNNSNYDLCINKSTYPLLYNDFLTHLNTDSIPIELVNKILYKHNHYYYNRFKEPTSTVVKKSNTETLKKNNSNNSDWRDEFQLVQTKKDNLNIKGIKIHHVSLGINYWKEFNNLDLNENVKIAKEQCEYREKRRLNRSYAKCNLKTIVAFSSNGEKTYFNISDQSDLYVLAQKFNNQFKKTNNIASNNQNLKENDTHNLAGAYYGDPLCVNLDIVNFLVNDSNNCRGGLKEILRKNHSMYDYYFSKIDKTQIAKAEPSQTQNINNIKAECKEQIGWDGEVRSWIICEKEPNPTTKVAKAQTNDLNSLGDLVDFNLTFKETIIINGKQYQIGVVTDNLAADGSDRKYFDIIYLKNQKPTDRYFINYYEDGTKEYVELQNINEVNRYWIHGISSKNSNNWYEERSLFVDYELQIGKFVNKSDGKELFGVYNSKNKTASEIGSWEVWGSSINNLNSDIKLTNKVKKQKFDSAKFHYERTQETLYKLIKIEDELKKQVLEGKLKKFAKENLTTQNKKVAKKEPKKEEFKPDLETIDSNKAPKLIVQKSYTFKNSSYEIKGKFEDEHDIVFIEVDGRIIQAKDGKFSIQRFSPVDEEIKLVAIDKWGKKSEPLVVKINIDIEETIVAENIEPLNPNNIRTRSNKNRVALIIGIEKYEQTPAANFANLDAQYFYEYARKGFGIPKANIKLLVDEEASLITSISTINKWLPSKIKNNQTELIIFFAGHGLASTNGEELYILPQDSDPDLLSRTALSRTELFEQIIKLNPKSVTMFMDTCYSGISRDEKMLLASARPIRIVADDQEGIPDNFTIFTASKLDQISSGLKEAEHGIFSYYLMKGLEGKADSNQDKKITNGELLSYMDDNVSQKAAELGREQNPSLAGDPDKVLISYR